LSLTEQILEFSADVVSSIDNLGEFSLKGGQPSGWKGVVVSATAGSLDGIALSEEAPDARSLLSEPSLEILNPFRSGKDSDPESGRRGIDGED